MKIHCILLFLLNCCLITSMAQNEKEHTVSNCNNISFQSDTAQPNWIEDAMTDYYNKIRKELELFDRKTPYVVDTIQEYDTYFTIGIFDTLKIFHYTIVSPKKSHQHKNAISIGKVYYLNIHRLTNYTGIIGCNELLYDISFRVNGKRVHFISSNILEGPPVSTKDLKGLQYSPR